MNIRSDVGNPETTIAGPSEGKTDATKRARQGDRNHQENLRTLEELRAVQQELTDETCMTRTGRKPISCRWKDIIKCDNERVELRSRSVAREIKQKCTHSYFAGTPPLALVRYVISRAATLSNTGK